MPPALPPTCRRVKGPIAGPAPERPGSAASASATIGARRRSFGARIRNSTTTAGRGMTRSAQDILANTFGFDAFRPPQDAIVEQLIGGGDAVVLMPTGGGKSLCYQLPALARPGTGIVVSPLIALMQDQVEALRELGVAAACLNSALDLEAQRDTEQQLLRGELDLLYVAPERLVTERFLGLLSRSSLALFAIDEAHCVSQWGHDFRPEYVALHVLAERFPSVPRVALTATADAQTRGEIVERLHLQGARQFVSGFDRPNIRYRVSEASGNARDRLLRFVRTDHPGEAGIVYCLSRRKVESVAAFLESEGLVALPYHAGLDKDHRARTLRRFMREEGVIVVATIAFGMGIDKPDVRFVAHLNMPKSLEAYYQETGRAGRDGLTADAWMAYQLQDVIQLRQMIEQSEAGDEHKRTERHKLEAMLAYCETTRCRREVLLEWFSDAYAGPCGNCDNCLEPPDVWDATVPAQKALSVVHRTGQRFGVSYLVDVLLGKDDDRIHRFGHERQSTFGIGTELSATEWRTVFRQLIAQGLLAVDVDGHGGLRLDESCRPVLRGERRLELRRAPRSAPAAARRRSRRGGTGPLDESELTPEDRHLWRELRSARKRLAEARRVPPYVIFSDATLVDMLQRRPMNRETLMEVSGVGQHKLDNYGDTFLEVIRACASPG
jgi:ATP-dependent DNA helicase RecQ